MIHEEMISRTYDELRQDLPATITEEGRTLIHEAFELAKKAHTGQKRDNGLPYIIHPLTVALILLREMRQEDPAVIAAALLHDVVEDTPCTMADIRNLFGEDVAFLVGAVTKPNKNQVDNFQHILGSVKRDVRILLLKLSDRLHNMRTLSGLRPQKQWKIASETQFFFAPLAGRLGLYNVKSELENLAFRYLNPREYAHIEQLLDEDRQRTEASVGKFLEECLHLVSRELGGCIGWSVRYRKPYSIYREMQERQCDFYHVPFKHYIRVNFDLAQLDGELNHSNVWWLTESEIIFRIYDILTQKYREQTGSLVNYVAQPKANGYRSVHFRLLNPYGGIEEFHVASDTMREQALYGCILDSKEKWLQRLTEVLNELAEDPESLMPGIKDSFYNEDVVVYTPRCKAITLPKGATALDFAYGVHSEIGNHAKYARINGRLASVKTTLRRGDCVEIGTDDEIHPAPDWLDAAVSFKARRHIRGYLEQEPENKYRLCSECQPMPGGEIIGFRDAGGTITVHRRNCPDAIRIASEKGNTIVSVDDFAPMKDRLYPVRIEILGIDRYHLLRDIIDCIVENHHLSMTGLTTQTRDHIASCDIEFSVHSTNELQETILAIQSIPGVEEINVRS